jgi:hypothetical protein
MFQRPLLDDLLERIAWRELAIASETRSWT